MSRHFCFSGIYDYAMKVSFQKWRNQVKRCGRMRGMKALVLALTGQQNSTVQSLSKENKHKNPSFESSIVEVGGQTRWESSGRYSELFQALLFFWHLHINSEAAGAIHYCVKVLVLRWPGSTVKQLVFISAGERQGRVSSPLPLQMCLDQGELTTRFVCFRTLM